MVIVNSDDFGYDKLYNRAAFDAYSQNLISSLSCFVNYEEGLQDALEYVKQGKIDINAIGLHANLSAGKPLTERMAANRKFCSNGEYKNDISIKLFYLDRKSRHDVYLELVSQVEKFKKTFGKIPSHIDTHHHLHTHWGVLTIFLKVAGEFQIPAVRIARNTGLDAAPKKIYKRLVNGRIRSKGFYTVDYFGDVDNHIYSETTFKKNSEIIVHAIVDDHNNLIDMDGEDLKEKIGKILTQDYALKNFTDLTKTFENKEPKSKLDNRLWTVRKRK